jgi:hypothetical protein
MTKREWFLLFVCGWCARGIFEWPQILGGPIPALDMAGDIITGLFVLILLGLVFVKPRRKPAPAFLPDFRHRESCSAHLYAGMSDCTGCAFDVELETYLKRNDFSLITNETLASLRLGADVRANPYLKPNQAVFVNQDLINKLIRDWPSSGLFWPADNKHLPGCSRRHDPEATCICGERGFGGANPMPPRFAEEFRLLHEDPPRPFITCPETWPTVERCWSDKPGGSGVHRCDRNKAHLIGPDPRCLCKCGKTREVDSEMDNS